jgi:hypothetical protein
LKRGPQLEAPMEFTPISSGPGEYESRAAEITSRPFHSTRMPVGMTSGPPIPKMLRRESDLIEISTDCGWAKSTLIGLETVPPNPQWS